MFSLPGKFLDPREAEGPMNSVLSFRPSNPFELQNLTVISDVNQVFDYNIFDNITKLESTGSDQLNTFINDGLIVCKASIKTKVRLNHFILLGDEKSKKPRGSVVDKRLTPEFLTKLRDAITYRRDKAKELFSTEIFGSSQCLSLNKNNLYHGTKSNILQRIESTELPGSAPSSAIIIGLSAIMRCSFDAITFDDFAVKIYNHILGMAEGYNRIDVICDRYFETSLKNLTRKDRGCGATSKDIPISREISRMTS